MNRLAGIAPLATSYRILFINDADALTLDAQQALRRTIKRQSRTCKFILATERPSRVIVPIRSRCLPMHFTQLPVDMTLSFLQRIASDLSLIHISEPTRLGMISYAVFCLK